MPHDGGRYFDGTLGSGGHARTILDKSSPGGQLTGTDLDKESVSRLTAELAQYEGRAHLFQGNYSEIDRICMTLGWDKLDGILLDLGMSSTALDDPDRGFSFLREGPLDMRFSLQEDLTAEHVVNNYDEMKLATIIRQYGEERFAKRIARFIVDARPIKTTTELSEVVSRGIPRRYWPQKIHPATKTFQAIRMEVNQEIENINTFLPKATSLLAIGGIMAVISYHSLEDRIIKRFFSGTQEGFTFPRGLPPIASPDAGPKIERVTRKSIVPSEEEILENPRARSARLRAVRRVS